MFTQHQARRNTRGRRRWFLRNKRKPRPVSDARAPHHHPSTAAAGSRSPVKPGVSVGPRRSRALEALHGPCRARLLPFIEGVVRLYAVRDVAGHVRTQLTNRTLDGSVIPTLGAYEPDEHRPGFARWVAAA
jgi:hypothetical protein